MERSRYALLTIDLDGTLLRGTVFAQVARESGHAAEVARLDAAYLAGEMTLEECFWQEYRLLVGKRVDELQACLAHAPWLAGIEESVSMWKEAGLRVAVLTDQPRFLVSHLTRFGLQEALCSEGGTQDGFVSEGIEPAFDKLSNLRGYLARERIDPVHAIHVGNGQNDVPVFEQVGLAIAVNAASPEVAESADLCFESVADLRPVAEQIVEACWSDRQTLEPS